MEDSLSPLFNLKCGLPQGFPLSPILYIIYNSSLLSLGLYGGSRTQKKGDNSIYF
jgi:hypothetical protein